MLSLKKVWDYPELEKVLKTLTKEQVFAVFPWGGCVVVVYEEKEEYNPIPISFDPAEVKTQVAQVVVKEEKPKTRRRLSLQDVEGGKEG